MILLQYYINCKACTLNTWKFLDIRYKIIPHACEFSFTALLKSNGYRDIYNNCDISVDDYHSTKFQCCPSLLVINIMDVCRDQPIMLLFLNQARVDRRLARVWFLKVDPVWIIGMRVRVYACVCVRARGY